MRLALETTSNNPLCFIGHRTEKLDRRTREIRYKNPHFMGDAFMNHNFCQKHFNLWHLFQSGFFGLIFLLPNPTSFCYSQFN
jgi:hypothetical protein